jgi:hypothetical protein
MFTSKLRVLGARAAFATAIAVGVLALAAATPTFAQTPAPTARGANRQTALQNQFKREQKWFGIQTTHLANTNKLATTVQSYINAQNAKGKDTSALAAALATFNSQIATAQSSHTTAGNSISAHAGFDANGNVTDVNQAYQTVVSTRQSLWDAHRTIEQAVFDLRTALLAYRQANAGS